MNLQGGFIHGGGRAMWRCIPPAATALDSASSIAASSAHPLMAETRAKTASLIKALCCDIVENEASIPSGSRKSITPSTIHTCTRRKTNRHGKSVAMRDPAREKETRRMNFPFLTTVCYGFNMLVHESQLLLKV